MKAGFFNRLYLTGLLILLNPASLIAADQQLGGTASTGNLRITAKDSGGVGIGRYDGSSWISQIFSTESNGSKGSYLYFGGAVKECKLGNYFYDAMTSGSAVSNTKSGNTITTILDCTDPGVQFKQEITYVDGQQYISFRWTITNNSGATLTDLRFFHGEDTYLAGGDNGAGFWDSANNTIGVQKTVSSEQQRLSLQGIDAPTNYESDAFSNPSSNATGASHALNNVVDPSESTDNGYALEWRNASLPSGSTWVIRAYEKFGNVSAGGLTVNGPVAGDITAGLSTDLSFTVSNTTGASLSVTLTPDVSTCTGSWSANVTSPSSPVSINGGADQSATIRVTAPSDAAESSTCDVKLTATSGSNSGDSTTTLTVQAAPTPTPTATATVTETPTPTTTPTVTYTPTQTVTNSPTATVTNLPALTPTPTSTTTATPLPPTPTAIPTVTPTATPATDPDKVEVVIIIDGQPVSGALVYIAGTGTCLTNSEGKCSIAGLETGKTYQVVVQKTGVVFSIPEFSISGGQSVTVSGTGTNYNPASCTEKDQASGLNTCAQTLRTIFTWAQADFGKLSPTTTVVQDNGRKISAATLSERVERQYTSYLDASRVLPEISLRCSGKTGCTSVDLSRSRRLMLREVNNIRHEALLANRALRERGKRTLRSSSTRISRIVRQGANARKNIRKLLKTTWTCK